MKLKASYFQPSMFIKKEATAQVFSCEFCEIFKETFFIEQLRVTASVASTFIKVRFLIHCTLFSKLCYFSNIIPKPINLVSLESYYHVEHQFKKKKIMLQKMAISFLNCFSKSTTIWIFSKLQFILITNIKLLFRSRNCFKNFPCKIG